MNNAEAKAYVEENIIMPFLIISLSPLYIYSLGLFVYKSFSRRKTLLL